MKNMPQTVMMSFQKEYEILFTAMQEAYDRLLEENKMLKSADNNNTAEKNENSEETN